jgi:hypothetical protein
MKKSVKIAIIVGTVLLLLLLIVILFADDSEEFEPHILKSVEEVIITPWDVDASLNKVGIKNKKPYTIMVYLNGSDLETEYALATADLLEMVESGFNTDNIHLVVLTGGSLEWHNDLIPSDNCAIIEVTEELKVVDQVGLLNMGDSGTLTGFIDFAMQAYPAEKYGLILWNHGGGSILGFGVDEHFAYDNLSTLELSYALNNSKALEEKFEFIGFDACLMATVEVAHVTKDYAHFLIASQDLEPGSGWDYGWLQTLGDNPHLNGAEIGETIVDTFTDQYTGSDENSTLSIIDLDKIEPVIVSMGKLMEACNIDLSAETFSRFAQARNNTRSFGGGSPRESGTDMVDIVDMAYNLMPYYPDESLALIEAVNDAVIYYQNSENVDRAFGLSAYYIFDNKKLAEDSIQYYQIIDFDPYYTTYLTNFGAELIGEPLFIIDFDEIFPELNEDGDIEIKLTEEELDNLLEIFFTLWEPVSDLPDYYYMLGISSDVEVSDDGTIITEFDGYWPGINGEYVCLYEIEDEGESGTYAIPAELNGREVDIIVLFNDHHPDGKIIGARPLLEHTEMAAKALLEINPGDRIKFLYYATLFVEQDDPDLDEMFAEDHELWYESEEIIVEDELVLELLEVAPGEIFLYGFLLVDVQQNEYFTDFIETEFY